jgi:hypothetical protein
MAVWRALKAGGGQGVILRIWLIVAISDIVFETPALWLRVFYYYGPQPLDLWGMPLYWGFMDGALGVAPGVLAYLLWRREWGVGQHLALLMTFPASLMFVYVGAGWPIWFTMHTDLHQAWIEAAALVAVALVFLWVRAMAGLSRLPADAVDVLRTPGWSRADLTVVPSKGGAK